MGMAVAVVLGVLLLAGTWALVREVRADGRGRRPARDARDWGDRRAPSSPYSRARW